MLIIAGTSGATTLPNLIANCVYRKGGTIIDINLADNTFTDLALNSPNGRFINKTCSAGLAELMGEINSTQFKHR